MSKNNKNKKNSQRFSEDEKIFFFDNKKYSYFGIFYYAIETPVLMWKKKKIRIKEWHALKWNGDVWWRYKNGKMNKVWCWRKKIFRFVILNSIWILVIVGKLGWNWNWKFYEAAKVIFSDLTRLSGQERSDSEEI